jgi:hypothetical protein
MYPVPDIEIRKGGEHENEEKEAGSLPVEEQAGQEEKCIPQRAVLIHNGKSQQNSAIENPEIKLGKDQWLLRVKEKYVAEPGHGSKDRRKIER